jgi:hypothetical protein
MILGNIHNEDASSLRNLLRGATVFGGCGGARAAGGGGTAGFQFVAARLFWRPVVSGAQR